MSKTDEIRDEVTSSGSDLGFGNYAEKAAAASSSAGNLALSRSYRAVDLARFRFAA